MVEKHPKISYIAVVVFVFTYLVLNYSKEHNHFLIYLRIPLTKHVVYTHTWIVPTSFTYQISIVVTALCNPFSA